MLKAIRALLLFGCILLSNSLAGQALLDELDAEFTGVGFVNVVEDEGCRSVLVSDYYYNGAGVAAGDLDGDGLPDLVFISNFGEAKIYRNKGGLQFIEVKVNLGENTSWRNGVALVDIDGDGDLDIYISASANFDGQPGRNELFINKSGFNFEEKAAKYGLDDPGNSTQSHFFDFDHDGDLDVLVLNRPGDRRSFISPSKCMRELANFESMSKGRSRLYQNNGQGKFEDVSDKAGITADGYALSAVIADVDGNGWPDIFISHDYEGRDELYMNQGDGKFAEDLTNRFAHISWNSMGSDFGDVNDDGRPDIFVTDMSTVGHVRSKQNMGSMSNADFHRRVADGGHYQYMSNALQINNGDGSFSEVAQMAGVAKTDWSWSSLIVDLDLDGRQDILVTNGIRRDVRNNDLRLKLDKLKTEAIELPMDSVLKMMPVYKASNRIYRNSGGLNFEDVSEEWGFDYRGWSHGICYADLDSDGDMDLVMNNLGDVAKVYKNLAIESGSKSLRIRCSAGSGNALGVGTEIIVESDSSERYFAMYPQRGYMSSHQPLIIAGLGNANTANIRFRFPGGEWREMRNVNADQVLVLDPELTKDLPAYVEIDEGPLFQEISLDEIGIDWRHKENSFDEFVRQPLLPHLQGRDGPAVLVGDLNGDSIQDIFFGAAAGDTAEVYFGTSDQRFQRNQLSNPWQKDSDYEDVAAELIDINRDGRKDIYVASGGTAHDADHDAYLDRVYINAGKGKFYHSTTANLSIPESASCLAKTDFNKDGAEDLFLGSGHVPGQYPHSPESFILENRSGKLLENVMSVTRGISEIGLVKDACWADVDGDGWEDLIVVGEWTNIMVFKNQQGKDWQEITRDCDLDGTNGWWRSITAADVDGDGDMDLVAGNIGLNTKYHASFSSPLRVHSEDFDNDGRFDIVLSQEEDGRELPVRGRECSSEQCPFILQNFPDYNSFAHADLPQIYGEEQLQKSLSLEAHMLQSVILLNDGKGHFQIQSLPAEAQVSPVQDCVVKDFTGDGKPDLLFGGNFYDTEVETVRYDAGIVRLLEGNGNGIFRAVDPSRFGPVIGGNIRKIVPMEGKRFLIIRNNDSPSMIQQTN